MKTKKLYILKLGMAFLGIVILLWNCKNDELLTEPVEGSPSSFSTVSPEMAQRYMTSFLKPLKTLEKGSSDALVITPLWETLHQSSLPFTDALITDVSIDANIELLDDTKLFFINKNDSLVCAITSQIKQELYDNGRIKGGVIFFHSLEGRFLDAYRIKDGRVTHKLVAKTGVQEAALFMSFFYQECDGELDIDVLIDMAIAEGGHYCFDEVNLGSVGGSSSGESGDLPPDPYDDSYEEFFDGMIGSSSGGSSNSTDNSIPNCTGGKIRTSAGSCECPSGTIENNLGNCVQATGDQQGCEGGKVYNTETAVCECPDNMTEDANGTCIENPCVAPNTEYNSATGDCICKEGYVKNSNLTCVKKPCPGDPVKNPEIAPQKGKSGVKGGLFGCNRFIDNQTCGGQSNRKSHSGVDIKTNYGDPIFATHDGHSKILTQFNSKGNKVIGAGYYVEITSVVNGETVQVLYFHLQKNNRRSGFVKSGDVIGYQGLSGNLKDAIAQGYAESHVHIKIRKENIAVNPNNYLSTTFDEETGQGIINKPCK